MTLEEAYKKLSECYVDIKNALKAQRLEANQAIILEALALAKPKDVGTAGSIANLLEKGVLDPKIALKILNSRTRPWEEMVCDSNWGIPPTPEAEAEWNRRKTKIEDFARLKAAVFSGRNAECITNGAVLDKICEMAGLTSFHDWNMARCDKVSESTLSHSETVAVDIHEVLVPLVISAGMQCGKVNVSTFYEYNGTYYCTFEVDVGSTKLIFKKVKI